MCYCPITIKNNSKMYRPLVSKDLVKVPCGRCRECHEQKENEWFVRIYYEFLRTCGFDVNHQHGRVFFVSPSYNDDHLPYLDTSDIKYSGLVPILHDFILNRSSYCLSDEDYSALKSRVERYEDRYDASALSIPSFSHACFDDSHVTQFFKSLRQFLNADGVLKYGESPLKYFCVTEYGDNKHRPHWHMLIFVPKVIDSDYFLKVCRKSWSHIVKRSDCPDYVLDAITYCHKHKLSYYNFSTPGHDKWFDWHIIYQSTSNRYVVRRSRGFVNYSKDETGVDRPFITDIQGCKYLTRYLNYYDNYLKDLGFEQLKDWIKLFPSLSNVSGYEKVCELLHSLNLVFPFKRVSQNFGSLLIDQLSNLSEDELKNKLIDNKVVIPNEQIPYPIPSYIVNRLCYVRDQVPELVNPVSFFTPLGYKVFVDSFDDRINSKIMYYRECVDVLKSFLVHDDYVKFKELFGYDISIINQPCLGFTYNNLALFDVVLNGVSVSHMTQFMDLRGMSVSQILDNVFDLYLNQLILRTKFVDAPQVLFDDLYFLKVNSKNYLKDRCYNSLPQFEYYDKFLTVVDYIRNVVLTRDAQSQQEAYTKTTVVRESLNKYRYPET